MPDRHPRRWNRDFLFDILRELEIHHVFGVPGTNEIPIIDGTSDPANDVQYVECLNEAVAIGSAMGWARMSGKPGVLIVHVTPGVANILSHLFNAQRSGVPLVVICGQQQDELVTQEPLLASNLVEVARQYTKWAYEVRTAGDLSLVLQRAFKEAMAPPNGPVFVSVPWEFAIRAIGSDDRLVGVTRISPHFTGDPRSIELAATLLAEAHNPIIVAGDRVGASDAWSELQELAELLGAPVVLQGVGSTANFPNDDVHWQGQLPVDQAGIQGVFESHDVAFLCGFTNQAQVTVFKHSDGPLVPPNVKQVYLSDSTWDIGKNHFGEVAVLGDVKVTLPLMNDLVRVNPPAQAAERNSRLRKLADERVAEWRKYLAEAMSQTDEIWGVLVADALRQSIEQHRLHKQFVYVNEVFADTAPFTFLLPLGADAAAPVSYYDVGCGGPLGYGLAGALGIRLEARGRQGIEPRLVVAVSGDGSTLFYPQGYWTAANHEIDVLHIILNNREYHSLQLGLQAVVAAYGTEPGFNFQPNDADPDYLRIARPDVDLVGLAKAFGVLGGETVRKPGDVHEAVNRGVKHVLETGRSYVLDVRTDQATPAPPPLTSERSAPPMPARYAKQPPLDVFHHGAAPQGDAAYGIPPNGRIIF